MQNVKEKATSVGVENSGEQPRYRKQSKFKEVWKQYKKNKGAMIGLILLSIIVTVAVVSNFVFDYNVDIAGMNASQRLLFPSLAHPFGTDHMGRSILARVCYGAKYSLIIGFSAVAISLVFGMIIGSVAGYYGGKVETIIMRIVELFLMVPSILLVIIFVVVFGTSITNLIVAMGCATIPHFARNARASVLTVRGSEYVEAAKAVGATDMQIIFKHIIPNSFSPVLVQAAARLATAIIDAAAFSFLGLGVPAPLPEWGAMLSDARQYLREYPYLTIVPGLAVMLTVFSVNLIGDGLRDALDPKLKR